MALKHAVVVRNAMKQYEKGTPVLNGLNLTVARGTIYSLLGASGCGKTTLLSCIVGVKKLDSGDVWVLGGRPGSKGSGIPGPRVGYMPQEISLVPEFTVIGAFYYFGRINGMDDKSIEERYEFLHKLLQLPPRDRLIKDMSGGQQRRVSFGAALIHSPELLILDEPTVGIDPVLRDDIWNYLVRLTQEEGITVIITTHYIDEAKQANRIGLMRCGQLLAESSPNKLLERFQSDSLEDVFLTLSQMQNQNLSLPESDAAFPPEFDDTVTIDGPNDNNYLRRECSDERRYVILKQFKALLMKNIVQFMRHPGGILFAMVLPIVQTLVFYNSVGLDPKGLRISVVNEEAGNCGYGRNVGNATFDQNEFTCNFRDLSCRFLDGFDDSIVEKVYYANLLEAREAVTRNNTVGVMHFGKNFSRSLQFRLDDALSLKDEDYLSGQIQIWLDSANRQISMHVKKRLLERFFEIFETVMKECGFSKKLADVPVRFEDPIFGSRDQKYSTFVAPAFILTLVFFLATSVCSSIIIGDRCAGVWDRSLVQGVKTWQILITHLITQFSMIIIQVAIAIIITYLQPDVVCKGSWTPVISLTVLSGLCGMSYGFLISVVCTTQTAANYLSTGSFYPFILLSGCIWPIEGMPTVLRWISMMLPTTLPSESLRNIMNRGYSVDDPKVYTGFLVVSAWIVGLISFCLVNLKAKSA